jgi:hypothetical protein
VGKGVDPVSRLVAELAGVTFEYVVPRRLGCLTRLDVNDSAEPSDEPGGSQLLK